MILVQEVAFIHNIFIEKINGNNLIRDFAFITIHDKQVQSKNSEIAFTLKRKKVLIIRGH
jgi:hypothetical protein